MSEPAVSDPAPDPQLDAAVKLHQAGKIDRAAKAYREILERAPDHANALHLLGVTELQAGHYAEAVELISRAIARQPNTGVYHVNLAAALRALRRIDDAIEHAERAIVLNPNLAAQGYHVAALAFADGGQPQDAIDCWVKALDARPEFAEAHLSISMMMDRLGKYYFAVTQQEHAVRVSRASVEQDPDNAPARVLLGRALEHGGKLEEAIAEFRVATRLLPHDAGVFLALGRALAKQGQPEEAMTALRFAVRMNPKLADAHAALGSVQLSQGRVADAIEALRTAFALLPDHPDARAKLADALAAAGETEAAVAEARAAHAAQPDSPSVHSTLLRTLLLDWRISATELFDAHLEWERRHGAAMQFAIDEHAKWDQRTAPLADESARMPAPDKDPDRRLRIGFVSPHLCRSSQAKLLVPLLEELDRGQFEIACYSDAPPADDDEVTTRIRRLAGLWRETWALTDTQLALLVRADRVDILIDLAGHGDHAGHGGRMIAFAQKPAPVQVTMLGYPFTTGVGKIDWRLSDETLDPPAGVTESQHVEQLHRLPRPPFAYRPWENTPRGITNRAALGPHEPITFGCVSDTAWISAPTISAWAALLARVAGARLLVMSSTRDEEALRQRIVRGGVDASRIVVVAREEGARYLDFFNRIDVALDTFPFSGGAAAGDALYMARPIVTLAGALPASRTASVFLRAVGLADLVATSAEHYVDIATGLAQDERARLTSLASTLRETLIRSEACNVIDAAAAVGQFYRDAWRRYCRADAG